jgi:hypothetical protein
MSVESVKKQWKLDYRYDDSDPSAKTLISEILKAHSIKDATLSAHLPVKKYPREDGYVIGIKLRDPYNDAYDESVPPQKELNEEDIQNPLTESFYLLKESARLANNKVAELYKSLDVGSPRPQKKEGFPDWFKCSIWRKVNGSLEKVICPVCSLSIISAESFSAGHILPESKGGMMCLENVIPICPECNSQMGARHLYWFAWHYYGKVMWSVY